MTALENVCTVCETPDGDHLDWCTPQARQAASSGATESEGSVGLGAESSRPREMLSSKKHLTAEKLAEYREIVQYGSLVGVGGSALASLLDEIERLRAGILTIATGGAPWPVGHAAMLLFSEDLQQPDLKPPAQSSNLVTLLRDARASVKKAADSDCVCVDGPQRCKYCAPHRALLDRIDAALRSPAETKAPRYLRPSLGTASMFSAQYKLAVSNDWCRGWNALLSALEAAGCEADPNSPWPPLVPCPDCKGAGEVCVGYSGRDDDGNAPLLEPCDTCDRYGKVAASPVKSGEDPYSDLPVETT